MGSNRTRRPFIWQDEMAEVKNLFRKVAKVKNSGFTGFSIWKDEPTAETLSKNRLQRRRCQYPLDLTHLNYSELPYQALSHLHNIRGMCSRIQRQDLYVERKKKEYDADIHPSLIRRPITSASASGSWEGSDKPSVRHRPGSAPVSMGTPLHYTAPRPKILYDATHKCPRYKNFSKRPSSVSSSRSGRSVKLIRGTWDSAVSSLVQSSSIPCSTRNPNAPSSSHASFRLNAEFALKDGGLGKTNVVTSEVETSDFISEVYSSENECELPAPIMERPSSRLASKRPQQQHAEIRQRENVQSNPRGKLHSITPRNDEREEDIFSVDSGSSRLEVILNAPDKVTVDLLPTNRPPSRKAEVNGKEKPAERGSGLWALKQQQQRPVSADSIGSTGRAMVQKPRPSSSPSQPSAKPTDVFRPSNGHEKVRFGNSTPKTNKIPAKKHGIGTLQRTFDEELQNVLDSEDSCETDCSSLGTKLDTSKISTCLQATDGSSCGAVNCDRRSPSASSDVCPTPTALAGEESHVLIKHSTDPYSDFRSSMMRMIREESLFDKQCELEELFQYYMDLNPAIHHEVLRRVIDDIRRDLSEGQISR